MSNMLLATAPTALVSIPLSSAACAHAKLEAAQLPIGGTVEDAPTELDLRFREELNLTTPCLSIMRGVTSA